MMRRARPWWALLTTIALMVASLLTPRDGAANRVATNVDPVERAGLVERGDPDNPGEGMPQPASPSKTPASSFLIIFHPLPGLVVQISVPLRDHNWKSLRRSFAH